MNKKNIGYVTIEFDNQIKQTINAWARKEIKDDYIYTEVIEGKIEGGIATDKLHLTLFYGFDNNNINRKELQNYLNKIDLREIEIECISSFPIFGKGARVLIFKVNDINGVLKKIHFELANFPNFSAFQKFEYVPHITIAYIKDSVNIAKLSHHFPQKILVHNFEYHVTIK
ncbi:MAG: hypothetical protein WCJ59_00795 [bacterium]